MHVAHRGGEDELDELRKRAYGPDADIDQDPAALSRLRLLEDAGQRLRAPDAAAPEDDAASTAPAPTSVASDAPGEPEAQLEERGPHPLLAAARASGRWLASRRRSTLVMGAAALLIVAGLAVTLVVVQRVQTDPLQTGAVQVARLPRDSSYEVPVIFGYASTDGSTGAHAFKEFHGLRFVVGESRTFFGGGESRCLTVFGEAEVLDPNSQSFSGVVYSGCSAGDFPPIVQFTLDQEQLPREFRDALAGADGVQLVYDTKNDEVVVFTD